MLLVTSSQEMNEMLYFDAHEKIFFDQVSTILTYEKVVKLKFSVSAINYGVVLVKEWLTFFIVSLDYVVERNFAQNWGFYEVILYGQYGPRSIDYKFSTPQQVRLHVKLSLKSCSLE